MHVRMQARCGSDMVRKVGFDHCAKLILQLQLINLLG